MTPQDVTVTQLQLLTCAAVVGMPTIAAHPSSSRPLVEMLWRMGMVAANMSVDLAQDRWTRGQAYNRLDPSEKSAVSYFLGMTQAAVTSRYVLGYPHLVHADLLLKHQGTTLGGKRPDFVAVSPTASGSSAYSAVVEAKGRTNGFDQSALNTAKEQTRTTPAVRGLVPRERIASEAFFDDAEHWSSVLKDPDWQGTELEYGIETFLLLYYRNVIDAGRLSGTWEEVDNYYQFSVPGYPITLALPGPIVRAYDLSAAFAEDSARDEAALILNSYHQLVSGTTNDHFDDLIVSSRRSNSEESELFAVFETVG